MSKIPSNGIPLLTKTFENLSKSANVQNSLCVETRLTYTPVLFDLGWVSKIKVTISFKILRRAATTHYYFSDHSMVTIDSLRLFDRLT